MELVSVSVVVLAVVAALGLELVEVEGLLPI